MKRKRGGWRRGKENWTVEKINIERMKGEDRRTMEGEMKVKGAARKKSEEMDGDKL